MNSKSFLEKVSKCSLATVEADNSWSGWEESRQEAAGDEILDPPAMGRSPPFTVSAKG